jgi:FkbM family methyltransferase
MSRAGTLRRSRWPSRSEAWSAIDSRGVSIDSAGDVHVFDNGLRVYRRHLSPIQAARYRETNLHEPIEEEWFVRLVSGGGDRYRFVDVGAGIGYYAILVRRLRPAADVYCFEPLREHATRLTENLALNGVDSDGVRIFETAVCDRVGAQPFHQEDFGSRLLPQGAPAAAVVPTTTLQAVIEETTGDLDLVKVDVQGDELRVIAGAGASAPRIRSWIVGTHGPDLHRESTEALRALGCRILFEDPNPPHQPDGLIVARLERR